MEKSSKIAALLLISILSISSATPILQPDCGYCSKPHPHPHPHPKNPKPPIVKPPINLPGPIVKPPINLPGPIVKPPINLPGPIVKPPINLPPIVKPPITRPPITVPTVPKVPVPPVTVPPVIDPPKGRAWPPPPATATCPIDTLKLGACVDLLGGLVHIGLGDPAANECCPIISGLVDLEAAVCLCTTLKINALNLNIFVPLALQLLVTCGKTPPPGYTCSL